MIITNPAYGNRIFEQQVIVSNKSQIPTNPKSTVLYKIDGVIDMEDKPIYPPSGGLFMTGHNIGLSGLVSSADNYTMFESPLGGSGNVFLGDGFVTASGTNSKVFDLVTAGNFPAIEMLNFNFIDCSSLGEIDGYRQWLGLNMGRFGGTPTLTLSGAWNGLRETVTIVANLDSGMTTPLFSAGTNLVFSDRFFTDMRLDIPLNASFADFTSSNFASPSLFKLSGASFKRNGIENSSDTGYCPNLVASDLVCEWRENEGISNTRESGRITMAAQSVNSISSSGTFYDIAGTWAASDLQHMSSPSNGQIRNDGNNPQEFIAVGNLYVEGGSNNVVAIKIVKWSEIGQSFIDVHTAEAQVFSLSGSRDVATITIYYPINLAIDDYIKLQVANLSGTTNVTIEDNSYLQIVRQG